MCFSNRMLLFIVVFLLYVNSGFSIEKSVQFEFYDRSGRELQYSEVQRISKGTSKGWENDALLDSASLAVIQANPLNKKLSFSVDKKCFFAMNWEVEPNGFILIIIDNNGEGIAGGENINFTYQAALDMNRRLIMRMRSVHYNPSDTFSKVYKEAIAHLDSAQSSSSEAEKGAEGYKCLDFLSVAYDVFLREYGIANVHRGGMGASPQLSFTIDKLKNYREMVDLASQIAGEFAWIRVYMDIKIPLSQYDDVIKYCRKKKVKVLAQPIDSSDAKNSHLKSEEAYLQRFKECIARWPEIDAWEVGNEVNGSWLPRDIDRKVIDVVNYCHEQKKKSFLCFFWQINTDASPFDLFTWMKRIPDETRKKIDYVGLSIYVEQAPMGADAMDMVMLRMQKEFSDSEIGIAELGYWIKGQRYWWAYDKNDSTGKALEKVAYQYYRASFAYDHSFGGCYWWNYCSEFPERRELQKIIVNIRQDLAKESMSPE